MKPILTSEQLQEIKLYIKNHIDIAPLIKDYDIKGRDFSGAIITYLNRPDEDVSGIVLNNVILGVEGKTINFNRTICVNSSWRGLHLKGELIARNAIFTNSSFMDAFLPYVDYRNADFIGCDFCNCTFTIATQRGQGAKFDTKFFKDLAHAWNIEITLKEPNQ